VSGDVDAWTIKRKQSVGLLSYSGHQGRVANPRPVAIIKKLATGRVVQRQVLTRTVGHGETGFL